jgi:hypothetical protein
LFWHSLALYTLNMTYHLSWRGFINVTISSPCHMSFISLFIRILHSPCIFHKTSFQIGFWFWGFCTVCKINFPTTFREPLWIPSLMVISYTLTCHHWRWDPLRLPKRRREVYLAHRAKCPKPKISIHSTMKVWNQDSFQIFWAH